jgi:2-haloacid dehalogenase
MACYQSAMAYNLFLFDADDTLFDFKASETLSFSSTLRQLGVVTDLQPIYKTYRAESARLWALLEQGQTTKDFLKVERFRRTFAKHDVDCDPEKASACYLDTLPETVVLIEHAIEICQFLSSIGEIGIITNGIESVQRRRLKNSSLSPYIRFMAVSEECGHAKPDTRFFEYSVKMATAFSKSSSLVIGDRVETDIQGAHNFGVDSCLFNPHRLENSNQVKAKYEISHLSQLREIATSA